MVESQRGTFPYTLPPTAASPLVVRYQTTSVFPRRLGEPILAGTMPTFDMDRVFELQSTLVEDQYLQDIDSANFAAGCCSTPRILTTRHLRNFHVKLLSSFSVWMLW